MRFLPTAVGNLVSWPMFIRPKSFSIYADPRGILSNCATGRRIISLTVEGRFA